MNSIFYCLAFITWVWMLSPEKQVINPFCKVYGVIYIEEYESQAHYTVYETDSETFADAIIFEESNRLYTNKEGKWFFTEDRNLADYRIYFSDSKYNADFSVFFTDYESFAGCNQ
ncbi:MAG TPA: DUF6150 family protein [Cyclobacteriaceae bacterium]